MAQHVTIVEVGPRDGLQSEPEILSTESKRRYVELAIRAGLSRIEVASFVHPKRVPQMADAEQLIASLPDVDGVSYIGLLMNEKGLDRALETKIHEIGMVVVASDTYNQKNQGVPTRTSIASWLKICARAKEHGKRANVMISSAFGCPYEGEVSISRVVDIAEEALEAGPAELGIADTIGVAVPAQVIELTESLRHRIGEEVPLRFHLHNTRNIGLANAQAAIDCGAAFIDASIGGIGGCNFAPAATGNIPTDDLLYMLTRSGIETGVSLDRIIEASEWLQTKLGRDVPALLPRVGAFPADP